MSIHVLAATVWVGGQLTLAGLVPTARGLGEGAARTLARAFARIQWPAYGVLLLTGLWNVSATHAGQPAAWQAVLGVKIAVVLVAGLAAVAAQPGRDQGGTRRLGGDHGRGVGDGPGPGRLPGRLTCAGRPGVAGGRAAGRLSPDRLSRSNLWHRVPPVHGLRKREGTRAPSPG